VQSKEVYVGAPLTGEMAFRAMASHVMECETCAPGGYPVTNNRKCQTGRNLHAAWTALSGRKLSWFNGPA
jgi:hypothetical protein